MLVVSVPNQLEGPRDLLRHSELQDASNRSLALSEPIVVLQNRAKMWKFGLLNANGDYIVRLP
ncbi:hypothetical protein [Paenibacillus sp. N3.4]|uniref:hypothetical protein n=1 Tax=Paenibacillus sp. N3.4 TaxID=2603222 RepID=UPI0011C99295|nr:hypothetical protein [Paenibacillus sp. N3.4]TXK74694.1 hypothetical protein FU659_28610 [Paenibacillus sp. N3.4]